VIGDDAGEDLHQGRFAGAVFTDDGVQFARLDVQRDIVQGDDAGKALRHTADREQGSHGIFDPGERRCSRKRSATSSTSVPPPTITPTRTGDAFSEGFMTTASRPARMARLAAVTQPSAPGKKRKAPRRACRSCVRATATTTTRPTMRPEYFSASIF